LIGGESDKNIPGDSTQPVRLSPTIFGYNLIKDTSIIYKSQIYVKSENNIYSVEITII